MMAPEARIDVETTLQQATGDMSAPELYDLARTMETKPWFGMPALQPTETSRKKPNWVWPLVGADMYWGRFGTGTAAVYLANGHERLVRPMIFADGFSYGPSDLDALWEHLNAPYSPNGDRFLDQLLAAGVDIVLLGFDVRHTYVQVNAGVARACIRKVNQERDGHLPLIVGGVSMGGLITRYALAKMESENEDHETDRYLSFDSPHNGAWIPLILQQMAYFFETIIPPEPSKPSQAELIRSPAAQQLLWAWVENAKYSGPVATASPLRMEFLQEMRQLNWFPQRPIKLGVTNGRGDTVGLGLTPGEIVFDKKFALGAASATARFQPAFGQRQPVGGMHVLTEIRKSSTSEIAPFDSAPGGTLDSFGRLADTLGVELDESKRHSCFVPSVSAMAMNYDPVTWPIDLHADLRKPDSLDFALDEFCCDETNSGHSMVTQRLAEWILARIAK